MEQKLREMESKKAVLGELSKVLESRDSESGQTVQEILMEAASLRLFSRNHLRHEDFERLAKAKEAAPAYPRLTELHDHLTDLMSLHAELNSDVLEHPWRAIGTRRIDGQATDIIRLLETLSEDGASCSPLSLSCPHRASDASHGCIRLANWDIAKLAGMLKPGVPVVVE